MSLHDFLCLNKSKVSVTAPSTGKLFRAACRGKVWLSITTHPDTTSAVYHGSKAINKTNKNHLSHIMRKPTFCICKNKDADQRPRSWSAPLFSLQDITIPLLSKSEISSLQPSSVAVQPGFLMMRLIWSHIFLYSACLCMIFLTFLCLQTCHHCTVAACMSVRLTKIINGLVQVRRSLIKV